MNYTQNTVAKTFKVYAGVNFAACFLLLFIAADSLYLNSAIAILWIAASIVINVGIYAIGEIIQLLDDIKQNTAKARSDSEADTTANVAADLPEL